jgi:glycosyltransferase involved in cell wall biosynthesis
MKIALVHDWFTIYTGSERVVEQILNVYPQADLFSLIDFVPSEQRKFLAGKTVQTSFLQKMPFARKKYRQYLALMPLAIEQFDLSGYDIVISSSHAVAKGVLTGPDQLHVSYIHAPLRYAWDMQFEYLRDSGLERGLSGWLARAILHYIRVWDQGCVNRMDEISANSAFTARRIWKYYHREAQVIYPPVEVENFSMGQQKEDFYLVVGRMVQYKKVDLLVKAFAHLPERRLVVIGEGPDFEKVRKVAGPNVSLLGYQSSEVIQDTMRRARAFLFAAKEDFGITPIEAQACGTPVIAFGQGGVLETILGPDHAQPTGVFFDEQRSESVAQGVRLLEENLARFTPQNCRANAERFATANFRRNFETFVENAWQKFENRRRTTFQKEY